MAAQTTEATPEGIFVINADRLFAESEIGQSIREDFQVRRLELQAENERIIEELVAEEQDLAARRPDMDVEEFRLEAEAFDRKAIEIRAARDAKERSISEAAEEAQARFNEQVREVAGQVMIERGGKVILDSRSVYLALRSIDITDAVIDRLDGLAEQQTEEQEPIENVAPSNQEPDETAPVEETVSE
ncbi:OmpH family outer membrane protein [Cognatiyoonia sediminum]|uniref:OmpH family outer membrane protein n=1 Tax=Cognatiyoonia sediminum TaxID=1508389 RepID=UPI0013F4D3A7|nr:OmpH family outer membrane protein [Cognatiyoonia sediminum]